ncbi:hypothetical protein NDU88_003828 [Pleurodeles waltl]|uniref:Uncharacterized protein n=1 Tax=Pleurodeles waltl TaxID=8319 RepID=A0AAV7L2X0_PLEWA|nr:hypothetical protein NDU88_003828 [Pleurodeles waltl]
MRTVKVSARGHRRWKSASVINNAPVHSTESGTGRVLNVVKRFTRGSVTHVEWFIPGMGKARVLAFYIHVSHPARAWSAGDLCGPADREPHVPGLEAEPTLSEAGTV